MAKRPPLPPPPVAGLGPAEAPPFDPSQINGIDLLVFNFNLAVTELPFGVKLVQHLQVGPQFQARVYWDPGNADAVIDAFATAKETYEREFAAGRDRTGNSKLLLPNRDPRQLR